MTTVLNTISRLRAIRDVLLFSPQGKLLYHALDFTGEGVEEQLHLWCRLLSSLEQPHGGRLLFESGGYFICRTMVGYIVVAFEESAAVDEIESLCADFRHSVADSESRRQTLLKMLTAVDDRNKVAVLEQLADHVDREVAKSLVILLYDFRELDPQVRDNLLTLACRLLGDCGEVEAIEPLKAFIDSYLKSGEGHNPQVEREARVSLRQLEFVLEEQEKKEEEDGGGESRIGWQGVDNGLAEQPDVQPEKKPKADNGNDGSQGEAKEKRQERRKGGERQLGRKRSGTSDGTPAQGEKRSAEEQKIRQLLQQGKKQEAVAIIMKYIETAARQKMFSKAEKLRDTLIRIDSMMLTEIIRAAEVIEEHKSASIPVEHKKTWQKLMDLLSQEEFASLYHAMTLKTFKHGEVVVKQGTFLGRLLFVNSGQVQMFAHVGTSEVPVKTVGPGEVVGGNSFFESSVWTFSAKSMGAEIFVLTRSHLRQLEDEFPSLESKLIDFAALFTSANSLFKKTRKNRRKFERKSLEGRASAAVLGKNGEDTGVEFKGDLFDISQGGVAFCGHLSRKKNAEKLFGRRVRVGIPVGKGATRRYSQHTGVIVAVRSHHLVSNEYSFHVQFDTRLSSMDVLQFLEES